MAALEKLAIRGIRSFSPLDEQTIEFYMPMTIILGQNGSGKTTIIECLKYACTGKLPGGGNTSGQSWVHDPKLTNDSEVKACVKLRFTGKSGQRMVVIRSMQLQYKGKSKSATFKQVDGVIKTVNPVTKKTENMTHKCNDLNAYIPSITGISAAILDSVVFCHQEESSWPLQDGSTLKKKFDDIFDATRYTKALDSIDKCRKIHQDEAKNFKVTLAGLKERLEAAKGFNRELEAKKREIEALQAKLRSIEENISTLEKRRQEAEGARNELSLLLNDMEKKKLVIKEKQKGVAAKKDSLAEEMEESDKELTTRLSSFSNDQKNVEAELLRLLQKESTLKKQVEQSRANLVRLTGDKGHLNAKIEQLMSAVAERNAEMAELCEKYQLTVPRALIGNANKTAELAEGEIQRFIKELQSKRGSFEKELGDFRTEKAKRMEAKRSEMAEMDAKIRSLEHAKTQKQQERTDVTKRLDQVKIEKSRENPIADNVFERLDQSIQTHTRELEDLQKLEKEKRFDEQVRTLQRETNLLQQDIKADEAVSLDLRTTLKERQDMENRKHACATSEEELRVKCGRFNDAFEEQLEQRVEISVESILSLLDKVNNVRIAGQVRDLSEANQKVTQEKDKLSALKNNLARDRDDLEATKKEIASLNERGKGLKTLKQEIKDLKLGVDDDDDPDKVLPALEGAFERAHRKLLDKRTKGKVMDDILQWAAPEQRSGKPTCPCCMREMNTDEYDIFKKTMVDKKDKEVRKVPEWEENLELVRRLRGDYQKVGYLMRPLQDLEAKQKRLEAKMEKQEAEERELEDRVAVAETKVCEVQEQGKRNQTILLQLELIYNDRKALTRSETELEDLVARVANYSFNERRSPEEVEEDLKRKRADHEDKQRALAALHNEAAALNKRLLNKAQVLRDCESQKAAKMKSMERSRELDDMKKTLIERQSELGAEIQQLVTDSLPLKGELKTLQTEFNQLKSELDAREGKLQSVHVESMQRVSAFDQKQRRVKEAEAENYKGRLARLEDEANRINRDMSAVESQIEGLVPQIAAAQKELQDKDMIRRQIEDNLAYRQMLKDLEQQNTELSEIKERLTRYPNTAQIMQNVQNTTNQWREAREEKAGIDAKVETLCKLKREQELKLKSDTYKDVDKKYKSIKIKFDTTEMAVNDLARYHKALDRALMQYHSMKVEEINKIIRELWTRTYRGNDIEDIAIVSGEEGGTGRATKSYNYRVVMKKGGTILDMRNRCSAGQRVLASIVIRLALAETFCINCGVMTLDEPTTNLDHENKDGLAQALARLICERGSRQRNFQLIIITHDEDFVHMMKTALSTMPSAPSMPEHYWRISRQDSGTSGKTYSRIEQVEWGQF